MTDWVEDQVPKDEMIQPEDLAGAVRFLLATSPACIVPEIQFIRPVDVTDAAASSPGERLASNSSRRARSSWRVAALLVRLAERALAERPPRRRCWPRASSSACDLAVGGRTRPRRGLRAASQARAKLASDVRPPLRCAASIGQTPPSRTV